MQIGDPCIFFSLPKKLIIDSLKMFKNSSMFFWNHKQAENGIIAVTSVDRRQLVLGSLLTAGLTGWKMEGTYTMQITKAPHLPIYSHIHALRCPHCGEQFRVRCPAQDNNRLGRSRTWTTNSSWATVTRFNILLSCQRPPGEVQGHVWRAPGPSGPQGQTVERPGERRRQKSAGQPRVLWAAGELSQVSISHHNQVCESQQEISAGKPVFDLYSQWVTAQQRQILSVQLLFYFFWFLIFEVIFRDYRICLYAPGWSIPSRPQQTGQH